MALAALVLLASPGSADPIPSAHADEAPRGAVAEWTGWAGVAAADGRPHVLVAFVLVYVASTALCLPFSIPLALLAGVLFGRWLGTGVASLASTTGATLAFLTSRHFLRDWVRARFRHRLARIERGVERDGGYYLFTLRLAPVVPFWLINLGMGLTPIRARTFVWVSWAGMLPITFLYVSAAAELAEVRSPADVLSPGVLAALCAAGVVPLALRLLTRRPARPAGDTRNGACGETAI